MGMFDTIRHKIKVNVGEVEISEWQTKDLFKMLGEYKSGDSMLEGVRRIKVIGSCSVRGELILDKKGRIIGFEKEKENGKEE